MSNLIYTKLAAIMNDVTAIDKKQKNQAQGFLFRGIDDFMNALHTEFAKQGVIIIPKEIDHLQDSFESASGKIQFRSRVHMEYTFICEDGSFITADGWGEAADNGDKGYNKCKSVALKYILMQMFLVPTKDIADPDKETPEDVNSKAKNSEADNDISLAKQLIKEAKTEQDLIKIWSDFSAYHTEIRSAVVNKRKSLGI